METKKGFNVKSPSIRTILVLAIIAAGLSLAGCNEEIARIENRQLELQAMIETNAQQIAALGQRIEQNQQELQAGIEQVQNDIRSAVAETAAVSEKQVKLQEAVQNINRRTSEKIALVEENQAGLQAGIEQVRGESKDVAADMKADITAVKDEQTRLYETMQSNGRDFTNNVAVIEQNQQQWQGKVEELQQNFQVVTNRISTLGNDLSKLQEAFKSNIRELASTIDTSGKEQLKFQEKIQAKLLAFDNSIGAMKQSQENLQNQIKNVQQSAEAMSNELPAAIEQLRKELASKTEQDQPPDMRSLL